MSTVENDWYNDVYDMELYPYIIPDIPELTSTEERVRSQQEESAYRRYNTTEFPTPGQMCFKCHEMIWSDQGAVFVKGAYWNEEDMFLDGYHDDCYDGKLKPESDVKRTAKLVLESHDEVPAEAQVDTP